MNRKLLCVLGFIIIGLAWSCRTTQEAILSPQSALSIDEAKNWYAHSKSNNARIASDSQSVRTAIWDFAKNDQLADGTPTVVVPLFDNHGLQISIPSNAPFVIQAGKTPTLSFDRTEATIQKNLIIAKDGQGKYHSCVIVVMPTNDNRKSNKVIKKDKFDGTVMVYNESETQFWVGLKYKKGKLKSIIKPNASAGARQSSNEVMSASGDCFIALYEPYVGGGQLPARVSTSSDDSQGAYAGTAPSYFLDSGGQAWVFSDYVPTDCSSGDPAGGPVNIPSSDPNTPDQAAWLMHSITGGGGTNPPPPTDPFTPIPIDAGEPMNLGPTDLWFWSMRNNIGRPIVFTIYEEELIRNNYNLTYAIGNYVHQYNTKPDPFTFLVSDYDFSGLQGCAANVAYQLTRNNNNIKSITGKQVYGLYGAAGTMSKLTVRMANLPANDDARFSSGAANGSDLIELNSNLNLTTNEFLASILIHEFVHALLTNYPGGDINVFTDYNQAQHKSMFQSQVDNMAALLNEVYGTSIQDGRALALSSLQKIYINKFGDVNDKLNQIALREYQMSLADAINIGLQYRTGNKGTRCN